MKWLKHKCSQCGSRDTKYSHNYSRGWNNYCEQVYGDCGWYCHKCRNIDWETPLDEHLKTLPEWCNPYRSLEGEQKNG